MITRVLDNVTHNKFNFFVIPQFQFLDSKYKGCIRNNVKTINIVFIKRAMFYSYIT